MKTWQNNGWRELRGMGRLAVIGCMILTASLAARAEDLSVWQKRMPIAFSGYTPSGGETLTNFPVLVVLSNTTAGVGFDYMDFQSPPYGDLRFAAADKTTALDFEVESWDTNGLSHVWVRVPELTAETAIYSLWGKNGVGVPACTTNGATWMNGFSGVWHLSETNGVTTDSSSNRYSATITGTGVQGATGQIAGAYRFSGGSSSYVTLAITNGATATISAWAQNTLAAPADMLWSKNGSPGPDLYFGGGKILMNSGDGYANPFCNIPVTVTQLHHYVTVSDPAQTELFIDGRSAGKAAYKSLAGSPFRISSGWGQNYDWHGVVDEFQISSAVRSTNWIWSSYMNVASNDVFAAYGIPESQGFPSVSNAGGVTNVNPSSAWLNGSLSSTGTSDTAVFAYWGTTDGGTNASVWANTNIWAAPQVPGSLTIQATGLADDSTYYYRFAASNALGLAWASEVSVFITGEVWIDKLSDASEIGPTPGTFTVHRAAVTTNEALTVTYTVGGTATPGVDYTALGGTVTIPQGEDSVMIEVMPIFDHFVEGTETVELTLTPGPYMIGSASNATVEIEDAGQVARTWGGGGANALASNPANWVEEEAPIAGDAIVLRDDGINKNMTWDLDLPVKSWIQDGYTGTVTIATVYPGKGAFTNFTILGDCVISNGAWGHGANTTTEANRLRVSIGGNLIVGPNASVDVTGKGYAAYQGPGKPLAGEGGGSYGGVGNGTTQPGLTYGSIIAPTNLGSGGTGNTPWPGGGAVWVTVDGNARVDGAIRSDSVSQNNRTGSGGSVYITAGSINGVGTISVTGGTTGYGNGGGGRMALAVTNAGADFVSFTGPLVASGGTGNGGAGAGTIYLETSGDVPGKGELIVKNADQITAIKYCTTLNDSYAVTYEFSRIVLTNAGMLAIGPDDTLIATNTVLTGGAGITDGIWISGGTLLVPPAFAYSNLFIGINSTGSTFSPENSLTIGTNAQFRVDKPHAMNGDVIIKAGGKITHTANPAGNAEAYKIDLTLAGSLRVEANGSVDVTGLGFRAGYGPGKPVSGSGGGSYGGLGSETPNPGPCYGSIVAPINLGSGGTGNTPQSGGGVVLLRVEDELCVEGAILAEGANLYNRPGSGGSINIMAGALRGAGTISANGGSAYSAGGGGRVAVAVTNAGENFSLFTGVIRAWGGAGASAKDVGAGTVYLRAAGQGLYEGTLIIDNSNRNTRATQITADVTDTIVGDVLIRNKAYLLLATNQTLSVSGIWSNGASFAAQWGSEVIIAGNALSTSTVYGNNTFYGFICTNDTSKSILFEAGKTNTIADLGRLILKGCAESNLILRSTSDGVSWKLNVTPGSVDQSVLYVDVKDSDALLGVGAQIIALNSLNRGNNPNWDFKTISSGETNIWVGTNDTAWSLAANWSLDRPPVDDDFILIPSSCPQYPVLDNQARTVNGLTIQAGASLTLGGYDLTVMTNAVIAGTLTASGTETITLRADANFTGGLVIPALSTLVLSGNTMQTLNLAGVTFYRMRVENGTAALVFSGGFTATELRCEAPDGVRDLRFEAGKTVTLRDLVLFGATGATNIILNSTTSGAKWNLAVSGYRSVHGVDIQDSDANWGLPITAFSSKNSGGNLNWLFGTAPAVWLGTSSVNFHTAGNWSPAVVPDATARVLVESANPMTMTGAVSILDLTVGGGVGAASITVNALLTVGENIMVLSNGVLALNQPGVVSNDLVVQAWGLMTHAANAGSERYKLNLTVGGDVGVDANGAVDVTAKGHSAGNGPGTPGSGGGASYGGVGSLDAGTQYGPCYGSLMAPTNLGSGGAAGQTTAGGGAVLMTVGGNVRIDGSVLADGQYLSGYNRPGSGGSIFITAGSLRGVGVMSASGASLYAGSGGGRIALVVTNTGADFSAFTGTAKAWGGVGYYLGPGGAGTVYRQIASDRPGRGTVWVVNRGGTPILYTGVPSSPPGNTPGEADQAVFHVANAAQLRLTNDFTVGDIWLDTGDAWLDLGSNTLTVNARKHPLGLVENVRNPGTIIWTGLPPGVLIIVK